MRAASAALVFVGVLSGSRTAATEPCPPRAELEGDGVAVERVAEELERLGVIVAKSRASATTDAARPGTSDSALRATDAGRTTAVTARTTAVHDGCLIVRAQVHLDESGGIAVAVRGATRGSEGRVVSDVALAAAWIDSWTREDVDVALWAAPPRASTSGVGSSMSGIAPPSEAPVVTVPIAPTSRWERVAVTASYEQLWTDDDAAWSGVAAAVCVRVGGFCLGGRARLVYDAERLHNSTAVSRDDFTVLATASYPIAVGTMSIAPEIGLGVGRMVTERADGSCKMEPPPMCDPMTDPNCGPVPGGMCEPSDPSGTTMTPKVYVGDELSAATYSPRLSFALRIAIPLFRHVWLDGLAGMTYSPLGHTSSFEAGKTDATMFVSPESIALPGEPSSGYVLGIGIRVGAK